MCFTNLPIGFDEHGNPYLLDRDRFRVDPKRPPRNNAQRPSKEGLSAEGPHVEDVTIDPVTRVAGALGFHAKVDTKQNRILEAHSTATLFRGYEVILEGRDPRDAIDLSSRTCGVCGAVHSIVSSMALEMAFGSPAPPMGVWARNMGQAAAFIYDNTLHLFMLAGPDYSEELVKRTNPELLETAKKTEARYTEWHGYKTIGDIMHDMNPLTGRLYLEGLENTRTAREMASLMLGKYPHPSCITPGGLSTTLTRTNFTEYYTRLDAFFDYGKKVAFLFDDLMDFFLEHHEGFEHCGERPMNMINSGVWDDPDVYNARYEDADEWGEARLGTPGVIIDGKLLTTKLTEIDMGIEEFVEHSFYDKWTNGGPRFETNPKGGPISPYHPWNKVTKPKPTGRNWREKYSWGTSPRWDRHAMESGPHTRQWVTALAQKIDNPFIKATGSGLRMEVPRVELPRVTLEWKIPKRLNAAERMRGKAYHLAYLALVCYTGFREALRLMQEGETSVHTPYEIPKKGIRQAVGFWEAGRGYLTHHIVLRDGMIDNYQILTPSTFMASPQDPFGNPGPYEEAALNTPVLEDPKASAFKGIDLMRSIRSFDPCMPCTVHVDTEEHRDVVVQDVSSCACGLGEDPDALPEDAAHSHMQVTHGVA